MDRNKLRGPVVVKQILTYQIEAKNKLDAEEYLKSLINSQDEIVSISSGRVYIAKVSHLVGREWPPGSSPP